MPVGVGADATKNKVITLESSNKQVHEELVKLREDLKSALAAKQIAETALAAKEAEQKKLKLNVKLIEDNLSAIKNSVNEFTADIFGNYPKTTPTNACIPIVY